MEVSKIGRSRRIWNPKSYYHVVMRGNNRQAIFQSESDIANFYRTLNYTHSKYPFHIIAFCIMTNHYHLLIQSPHVQLGKLMGIINKRYSDYYRKKYNHTGFLYESRYWAEMVSTPGALLRVSRYIHRNPIETAPPIVTTLEDYPYSSYPFYKNNVPSHFPFLNLTQLPSYQNGRKAFCNYTEASDEKEAELLIKQLNSLSF